MVKSRLFPAWILVIAFVAVPLIEIYAILAVGRAIGPWWTIALLVVDSIVGGWLVKREGGRAWRALSGALQSGRMPSRELADGALILIGGTLMLTPGFVTDLFGILLVLPLTRPLFRRLLARTVARRLTLGVGFPVSGERGAEGFGRQTPRPRPGDGTGGSVVQGEVVDE